METMRASPAVPWLPHALPRTGPTCVFGLRCNRVQLVGLAATCPWSQDRWLRGSVVRCEGGAAAEKRAALRTCKNCKRQFDPSLNHPSACRFHTAHFGGETKRKFESVHTGGTMDTPDSGKVFQYWHCCGSEDPFDAGCTAAPHCPYDD